MSPSVRPSSYSAGTFLEPGNYVVRNPQWVIWDYDGKAANPTLAAKLDLIDQNGKVQVQYLSAGDPKAFAPSQDGRTLVQVGNRKDLSGGSNFAFFSGRLIDNGYSEDDMPEDTDIVEMLDGLYGYVDLEDAPDRSNMAPRMNPDGTVARKSQVPIFQQLHLMPWDADGTNGHTRPVALDNPQGSVTSGPSSAQGQTRRPASGPATRPAAAPAPAAPAQAANGTAPAAQTRRRRGEGAADAAPTGPSASDKAIDWLEDYIRNEGFAVSRDVVMAKAFSAPELKDDLATVGATLANPNIEALSGGRVSFNGSAYTIPELVGA